MKPDESGWLKAWDDIDRDWRRVEILLLLVLFAVLLAALVVRFGYALVGLMPPSLSAELPAALMIALVLLSASSALAEFFRRPQDLKPVRPWRATQLALSWLLAALSCVLMAGAGLRYLAFDIHMGSSSQLGLPGWWQLIPIPVIFLIMALRLLRQSVRQLTLLK